VKLIVQPTDGVDKIVGGAPVFPAQMEERITASLLPPKRWSALSGEPARLRFVGHTRYRDPQLASATEEMNAAVTFVGTCSRL
jgi:hypothetical protein